MRDVQGVLSGYLVSMLEGANLVSMLEGMNELPMLFGVELSPPYLDALWSVKSLCFRGSHTKLPDS